MNRRHPPTVVLVGPAGAVPAPADAGATPAGPTPAGPGPLLCGRPAVDWLLDTVARLDVETVTAVGADAAVESALRRWPRPAVRSVTRPPRPAHRPVLLVATAVPLVGATALARAVDLATVHPGPGRVTLIRAHREVPWWDAAPPCAGSDPVVGMALAGSVPFAVDQLAGYVADQLPDTVVRQLLYAAGVPVDDVTLHPVESLRTTDPVELAEARRAVNARVVTGWQRRGVQVEDPATTHIDATVSLAPGVTVLAGTRLTGDTIVGSGSRIGPAVSLHDCRVGADGQIRYAVCQDVELGDRVNVGPYAWLRSGASLGDGCRAGAFVEIADSTVGAGTSVPHLAGLFSADVGRDCNLASMSGPANFNGGVKSRVRIGDGVSIGAGTILVAPVDVGDGAETAAGSVITDDVPSGALGMARTTQRNVTGWAQLRRATGAA